MVSKVETVGNDIPFPTVFKVEPLLIIVYEYFMLAIMNNCFYFRNSWEWCRFPNGYL